MRATKHEVFTIGHSTHAFDDFVKLLKDHEVTAVADVRSAPYSRFTPQFNRESLEAALKAAGIRYVFLGLELGARSDDMSCYEQGRVQYARLAKTELFGSGLDRIIQGAEKYRVALMCAEKEPLDCHRTILVAQALADRGVNVRHILADGRDEPHEQTLDRLLDLKRLRVDLFRTRTELVAEALARQEEKIAWVDEKQAAEAVGER